MSIHSKLCGGCHRMGAVGCADRLQLCNYVYRPLLPHGFAIDRVMRASFESNPTSANNDTFFNCSSWCRSIILHACNNNIIVAFWLTRLESNWKQIGTKGSCVHKSFRPCLRVPCNALWSVHGKVSINFQTHKYYKELDRESVQFSPSCPSKFW